MTQEEKIQKLVLAIEQIDKALELRRLQVIKFNELKHALIQQTRALSPVFWLEGRKTLELVQLFHEENKMRVAAGHKPMLENTSRYQVMQFVRNDWITIEKDKWEKNKKNLDSGIMIA